MILKIPAQLFFPGIIVGCVEPAGRAVRSYAVGQPACGFPMGGAESFPSTQTECPDWSGRFRLIQHRRNGLGRLKFFSSPNRIVETVIVGNRWQGRPLNIAFVIIGKRHAAIPWTMTSMIKSPGVAALSTPVRRSNHCSIAASARLNRPRVKISGRTKR